MNCKQGDLAVIVKSHAGNEGVIVTCLSLYIGEGKFLIPGPRWVIDRFLTGRLGGELNHVADESIRPIRDTDGEDETLTWAGKPEKVTS